MSSTALYKACIEAGASTESATLAAEDVVQVSQLPELATKADISRLEVSVAGLEASTNTRIAALELSAKSDIARLEARIVNMEASTNERIAALEQSTKAEIAELRTDMANRETRLVKWMVGCMFLAVGLAVAGAGVLVQVMLTPGVVQ